jgi:hypothetical protein
MTTVDRVNFFVSYANEDRRWAEWIAWELEAANYTTIIQAWDFRPGENFIIRMEEALEQADRIIAIVSPAYLRSTYGRDERAAALLHSGDYGQKLVPIQVERCNPPTLLATHIYIDLIDLDLETARSRLIEGVRKGRAKPLVKPSFPGRFRYEPDKRPSFPGSSGEAVASRPVGPLVLETSAQRKNIVLLVILPFKHHPKGSLDTFLVSGFLR